MSRRINVTVPEDLDAQVRQRHPDVAYSQLLQQAMRDLLVCPHRSLECTACGDRVDPGSVAAAALNQFFGDLAVQLEDYAHRGGTVVGFSRVVRRLGLEHLVPAARHWAPPRMNRAELEEHGIGKTGSATRQWRETA